MATDFEHQTLTMLADIRERVARLESGNAERCKARGEAIDDLKSCQDDHETRIRVLEDQHAQDKGKLMLPAGVGAAVGAAAVASIEVATRLWGK